MFDSSTPPGSSGGFFICAEMCEDGGERGRVIVQERDHISNTKIGLLFVYAHTQGISDILFGLWKIL
jgi:hypothetical protein